MNAGALALAASPAFAIMALLTAAQGGGHTAPYCAAAGGSILGGMAPMYLLMTAFHAGPWVKLIAGGLKDDSTPRHRDTEKPKRPPELDLY